MDTGHITNSTFRRFRSALTSVSGVATFPLIFFVLLVPAGLRAQPAEGDTVSDGRPYGIASLSAGYVLTQARNDFPSLIVGESVGGSGVVPAAYATAGSGYAVTLKGLFYLSERVGLTVAFSSMRYRAEYRGDGTGVLQPTTLEVQEGQLLVGGHLGIAGGVERGGTGLRSLFLEGAFEVGLGVLADRVHSGALYDSASGQREEIEGSFVGEEPFRHRVAVRLAAGMIVNLTNDYEGNGLSLIFDAAYSIGLNPVFSSDVILDNRFSVNHALLSGGLGYRF